MEHKDLSDKIFLSLTGHLAADWKAKMDEINALGLETVALFLEFFVNSERPKIYEALAVSPIKNIPLIHIKGDMTKGELKYLCELYKYPYLTIHEEHFGHLEKWEGFYQNLYLELNYDNSFTRNIDIDRIGGFCVDLSHFKSAEEKWSKEFEYILDKRSKKDIFRCNHLSGYSYKDNKDVHAISSLKEFEYLKTLPDFIFGDVIAIEVFNSISDQIVYKKHILKLLADVY
ncbi:MAG: Uncharacterized protein LiPW39_183 [Parcubacteria group bacterium LiPW_39]|nr:MAG: Uncharacterized protein LiPW39_183 [Parcubacteria group bacterium LiPW_39]